MTAKNDLRRRSAGLYLLLVSCLVLAQGTSIAQIASDDFNSFNLNRSLWTLEDPLGDGHVYMYGTNTASAGLVLALPAGTAHDLWEGQNTAVRVLQSAPNTDFTIEVKFLSSLTEAYQVQGIIVQADANTILRADFSSNGLDTKIFAATTTDGFATTPVVQIASTTVAANGATPLWMRVARSGNNWTITYSEDGANFSPAGSFPFTMAVTKVGLFAGNSANTGSPILAHSMLADYFFNTASPLTDDGSTAVDASPPYIHNVRSIAGGASMRISWKTDEPSTSVIQYGTTTAYGNDKTDDTLRTSHSLLITGLSNETEYNFRIIAADDGARKDTTGNYKDTTGLPSPPTLLVWYDTPQTFGKIGNPQRWINILGNVTDGIGVDSLYYRLNGGDPVMLSRGPDSRRLQRAGDFNADIAYSALSAGSNTVAITAVNLSGEKTEQTVTVTNSSSAAPWPIPYSVEFSTASSLLDSAQIIDGRWDVTSGAARVLERGYDRLFAIGDTTFQDYEVTARLKVLGYDSTGTAFDFPSVGPAIGIIMRWKGHTNTPDFGLQPLAGYLPLGALGWIHWTDVGVSQWELQGNGLQMLDTEATPAFLFDTDYYFKMRVQTFPGQGGFYQFKAWKASESEPSAWLLSGQEELSDPQNGSALIVAHHVSALIDQVSIQELTPDASGPVISGVTTETGATSAWITLSTDEPAAVRIAYGPTTAYGDTASAVNTLQQTHAIGITGLNPGTTYHFRILARDVDDNTTAGNDSTVTTLPPAVATTIKSDEFNSTTLNAMWTFENPAGGTQATPDTVLQLSVPGGSEHDLWTGGNNVVRVMQNCNNTDFEVEVKFNSSIPARTGEQFKIQGILVEQDANDLIRLDITSGNGGAHIFAATFRNGFASDSITKQVDSVGTGLTDAAPVYLKVKREGNVWTFWYSVDGSAWTKAVVFRHALTLARIGVFAGNASGASSPAHVGIIDYFRADGVVVNLKAYLQGAYVSAADTMRTDLLSVMPKKNPYSVSPWNYTGDDSVDVIPEGVVDWVLVSLRTGTASTTAVDTAVGFIRKDGLVAGLDGVSPIRFAGVKYGSYYVVVVHRNHLAIMTSVVVGLNGSSPLYDFTTAQSKAYTTGANPMQLVGTKYGMVSGDATGNGQVATSDVNTGIRPKLGLAGYYGGDTSLNGQVQNSDLNTYTRPFLGRGTQVP